MLSYLLFLAEKVIPVPTPNDLPNFNLASPTLYSALTPADNRLIFKPICPRPLLSYDFSVVPFLETDVILPTYIYSN